MRIRKTRQEHGGRWSPRAQFSLGNSSPEGRGEGGCPGPFPMLNHINPRLTPIVGTEKESTGQPTGGMLQDSGEKNRLGRKSLLASAISQCRELHEAQLPPTAFPSHRNLVSLTQLNSFQFIPASKFLAVVVSLFY